MAVNIGKKRISLEDIRNKITDLDIINHYFNVGNVPCIIHSPLRKDNNPSFGFYSPNGINILFKDLSTKEEGSVIWLLSKYWGLSFEDTLIKLWNELPNIKHINSHINPTTKRVKSYKDSQDIELKCKVRDWESYDLEYWNSFGIDLKWLKYADVYPISHKIIIKDGRTYTFKADKHAYAYVERKEGKVTLKIYQPFNKVGYKWSNRHDRSVISLWTKVPEYGDKICICSSLKDALCLWANVGIPALAVQGEGYNISDTAINELKRRYKQVYILFDKDKAGIEDAEKLSKDTGFTNIVIPEYLEGKDISDVYKALKNKEEFINIFSNLFKN